MKRVTALVAAIAIASLGIAAPALAGPKGAPIADQNFSSYLDQLVAKGVITSAQSAAILDAMKSKRADRQAKMEAFAAKADVIIAGVLGMSVEKFCAARANRLLPPLTHEQKALIRTKLDALAHSMGLPKAPVGKYHKRG